MLPAFHLLNAYTDSSRVFIPGVTLACQFKNAQSAGAVAAIVIAADALGYFSMGSYFGPDPSVTIPGTSYRQNMPVLWARDLVKEHILCIHASPGNSGAPDGPHLATQEHGLVLH